MMLAWILPMLLVLSSSAVATGQIFKGSPGTAGALLPAFLALAGVNSPLIFPRSIGALEAQRRNAVRALPMRRACEGPPGKLLAESGKATAGDGYGPVAAAILEKEHVPASDDWAGAFGAAMLDRLLHRAAVIGIDGPSYRLRSHQSHADNLRKGVTGRAG
ncbi:hypothetical protein OHT57_00350 [Streptomyces sp. NBC_00285]|uniref:hypothetical protein n=1 Tax=Streptomyces sp. NBC_00285 TaxID=2975700 RepID=UPI002E2AC62D|nr:hypothetical protein [Streptomyces sp. NBC_00285]